MMTASETLIKAKELLDTKGWCRGYLYNDDGQHCAIGGITGVSGIRGGYLTPFALKTFVNLAAFDALMEAAKLTPAPISFSCTAEELEIHGKAQAIADYNNSRADYSQIAAWFDRAIELAQAKEMYVELAKPSSEVKMTLSQETGQEAQVLELTTAISV